MLQTATARALFFVVFSGAAAFGADPQLLNLAMPNAQVMAGINVASAESSPLGQYLIAHMSGEQALRDLIAQTGFDPRRDLTEVLAASVAQTSSAATADASESIVAVKGTFNVSQILAALGTDKTKQSTTYNGATLISGTDQKGSAVAFIGPTIAVMGNLASVKAAIDRSATTNTLSEPLASQVKTLSAGNDVWAVSIASLAGLIPTTPGNTPQADPGAQTFQLLKNIRSASSGIKFGPNIVFTGQAVADTAQNASALADVTRMLVSLAGMGAANQSSEAAALAQLLGSVQVSAAGAVVSVSATISEAQIETFLNANQATSHSRKM
jgi:hypothetical protein